VLPAILQMLIGERFRFILMTGTKFRYRSARLHGFRLEMKLTEDDMPPTADETDQAMRSEVGWKTALPDGVAGFPGRQERPCSPPPVGPGNILLFHHFTVSERQ